MFDYFTADEVAKFTFYRIPKLLITDEKFKNMSCESKMLYGLLLDRATLSKNKGWIDQSGKIYVYFKLEEAQEMLNIASGKAVKIFKELDSIGLIIRVKQGQGKPTKIYVMNFSRTALDCPIKPSPESLDSETFDSCDETKVKTCENRKSETSDSESKVKTCENRKSKLTKIESHTFLIDKDTEISNTESSSSEDEDEKRKSEKSIKSHITQDKLNTCVEHVKTQISYNELDSSQLLDELVHVIAWVYLTPESEIPISGVLIDTPIVVERFKQINQSHINQLIQKLQETDCRIKNPRNYLMTCLYNAPIAIEPNSQKTNSSFSIEDLARFGILTC